MEFEKIEHHIVQLGGMKISEVQSKKKSSDFDSVAFIQKNDLNLPEEYLQFVDKYGFHFFKEDVLFYSREILPVSTDHYCSLSIFFGWGEGKCSLSEENKNIYGQLSKDMFAIGEGAAGDFLCIGIHGEKLNKIYYWHHESPVGNDLFLVADSFIEFIMGIKKEDAKNKEDLGITGEWIAEDF